MTDKRGFSHHMLLIFVVLIAVIAIGGYVMYKDKAVVLESAIVSGNGGGCLDDIGGASSAGAPVEIEKCSSNAAAQAWQSANGDETIRINGLCLGPSNASDPVVGTQVKLETCQAGQLEQWSSQNGTLADVNTSLCLNLPAASSGTAVQLGQCDSSFNDQWTIPSPSTNMLGAVGEINLSQTTTLSNSGLCMDDKNNSVVAGNEVQLYKCNSRASQTWGVFGDESIRIHGLCLATSQNATADGSGLILSKCDNESSEAWISGTGGTIQNVASGRCVEAVNGSTGKQLQISSCNGSSDEQWALPLNSSQPITSTVTVAPNVSENATSGSKQALPSQAIAQKSLSPTQVTASNSADQHDLKYILGTVKTNVKCDQLHSPYAKQLLKC